MDKIPRMPSKTETYAKVRCKREEHKLSSIKDELDKIWHAESQVLKTHRNRFVIDRRRSLRNVYNSQIEGIQPHLRIRRPRRESASEVIDIFRRQEDRRRSIKIMEKALPQDVIRRLERKYHDGLGRNRSDVDEEDALLAPNIDIEGPDYEEREKDHGKVGKQREEDGEKYHEKTTKKEREQEEKDHMKMTKHARNEQGETNHEKTTKKETERKETNDGKIQEKETEQRKTDHKNTTRKEAKEEKDRRETKKKEREEEGKYQMKTKADQKGKSDKEPMKKESEEEEQDHTKSKKTEIEPAKKDHEKTKKPETEPWKKSHETTSKKPETETAKKHHEKTKKPETEKDEQKNHEKMKTKESEKDHSKPKTTHKTKPTDPSPQQRSKTSKSENAHTTPNQPSPKQNRPSKKATRYEDRNTNDLKHSTEDSSTRDAKPHHSDTAKDKPSSPVETRQIPKRKRSYSDGNIFMNIMELEDTIRQTYELSRAAAEVASEAASVALRRRRSDEDDSEEDDARMPYPGGSWGRTGAHECSASQGYSSETSENDTSDVELDLPESSPRMRRRRRVGEVSLEFPSPDVILLPRRHAEARWQTHERDVSNRVKSARRGSYPHTEEIRLSPSLQRRLANVGLASPRNPSDTRDDVKYSPSVTRRRADVSRSPAMTRRQADVTYFSPQTPRRGAWAASDRDSPTRWRKDDKPKRIYHQGEAEKQVLKRRPLRRSRSEAFDVSAFVTARERQDVGGDRMGRRGSDSLQGLSTARMGPNLPRGWNSLLYGLTLSPEEKEDIARHKRKELVTSLRKRQEEVDSDVSRRIRTFLQRYDDA